MQRSLLCTCQSYMKLTSHYTSAHFISPDYLTPDHHRKPSEWDRDKKKQSILRLKPGIINDLKRSPFLWLQSIDFYNKEVAQYIYPTRNILPTEENLWTALKILGKVNVWLHPHHRHWKENVNYYRPTLYQFEVQYTIKCVNWMVKV